MVTLEIWKLDRVKYVNASHPKNIYEISERVFEDEVRKSRFVNDSQYLNIPLIVVTFLIEKLIFKWFNLLQPLNI